jgi:hypothetical protein
VKRTKTEAWGEVAAALEGRIDADRKGRPERVTFRHVDWDVVLDTYTVSTGNSSSTYTRVRALFNGRPDGRNDDRYGDRYGDQGHFDLAITRRNPFHALAWLFRIREAPIGYGRFDRTFFVRSNGPGLAKSLLRGTNVGRLLLDDPKLRLVVKKPGKRIRKAAGEEVREVQLQVSGVVKDPRRVEDMVRLCMEVLDELVRLGPAVEGPVAAALWKETGGFDP